MKKLFYYLFGIALILTGCEKEPLQDVIFESEKSSTENSSLKKSGKINICHNGKLINVSINALKGHQNHGDAIDSDGDGYFDIASNCSESLDCDDTNPEINPGASEIPYNGIDDDCNPDTPDDDLDGDGFLLEEDCDDTNADINPEAEEVCDNGSDDNCDGNVDDCELEIEGLIAYYPFNGNANDESGNGNHGTVNNAVLTSDMASHPNEAYYFNDLGNKRISTGTVLNPTSMIEITVCAWVNLEDASVPCCDGEGQTIMGQGSGTGSNTRYPFWFQVTYNGRFAVRRNGPGIETDSYSFPIDGNWHFVAASIDEDNYARIFIDGIEVKNGYTGSPGGTNFPFSIGNLGDTIGRYGNTLNGMIDEVRIYNVALSNEEIESIYNYK